MSFSPIIQLNQFVISDINLLCCESFQLFTSARLLLLVTRVCGEIGGVVADDGTRTVADLVS